MLRVGGTRLTFVRALAQGKHTATQNARRTAMPQEHVVSIDPSRPLGEEPGAGHNRWHEAIEPAVEVDPGDTVVYETRDTFDGQRNDASTAKDVGNLDLRPVHPLTGPAFVKEAEPGDLLEVELVAIEADPWKQWGYTAEVAGRGGFVLPPEPGGAVPAEEPISGEALRTIPPRETAGYIRHKADHTGHHR